MSSYLNVSEAPPITMPQRLTPILVAELYIGSSGDTSLAALLEKTTIAIVDFGVAVHIRPF